MVTKDDVKKAVEQIILPNLKQIEQSSKLETLLDDHLQVEIVKSGWKSPNEVKLLRVDISEKKDSGKKEMWYVSYADTTKGEKHLAARKHFYEMAKALVEYDIAPECFTVDSEIIHSVSKKTGQSATNVITETRLPENDIACALARLLGASEASIQKVLGNNYESKSYEVNKKTLADTLLTNCKENENMLQDSLIGLVKEAKGTYLQSSLEALAKHSIDNKVLRGELDASMKAGDDLIKEIYDAKIDPYAPTIIVPIDIAPENFTMHIGTHKAHLFDQILSMDRQTVRGSPLTIVRTYERIIREHAFKHKDVFGKILQILKIEYYNENKETWMPYEPLVKKVTDYYHDARSTRRKVQEDVLKLASTNVPANGTDPNQKNLTEFKEYK